MREESKICQNCQQSFTIAPEDFEFYAKIKVPPPTWCPSCRAARRFIWRNEKTLWKVKSDSSGKEVFSMFPPGVFKIYDQDYWNSDAWDATSYGRDYDFSSPFFQQFRGLMRDVPWFNLSTLNLVNSDYCNNAIDLKNCYLLFDAGYSEDSMYSVGTSGAKNSFDLSSCVNCERSAHDFYCRGSYEVFYSENCENCTHTWFSKDCSGCSNCFGCVGLRNKSYFIFNKPYSKDAYFKELKKLRLDSYKNLTAMREKAKAFLCSFPVRYANCKQNQNSSGEYIYNSKNVQKSYWVRMGEDCRYLQSCSYGPINDSYDCCITGITAERCYECQGAGVQSANILFSVMMYINCYDVSYSINCHNVSSCFGCVGLQKKQYCIFNKQYTKEEYEVLVPRIIKHMYDMPYTDANGREYAYGEFFPPELSPFAYNETVAQEYLPLTRERARAQGFKWQTKTVHDLSITLQAADMVDSILDTGDAIVNEIIGCIHKGKCEDRCTFGFRITAPELTFYKKIGLALPRLCFMCRHAERLKSRNPMQFWYRRCMCQNHKHSHGVVVCPNEFETSYAPDRPEIVYCEQCYQVETV